MHIGSRIKSRLQDLGWSRQDLLSRVEGLSDQALSNLIVRDSKRSEWDEKIAEALGVSVLWLVYGHDTQSPDTRHITEPNPAPYTPAVVRLTPENPYRKELLAIIDRLSDRGMIVLIDEAERIAARFPRAKANPAS